MAKENASAKNPFNWDIDVRTLYGGAHPNISSELLGVVSKDKGYYYLAINMRVSGSSLVSVEGEIPEFSSISLDDQYVCVGSYIIGEKIIGIWAPYDNNGDGILTINSVIGIKSPNFQIRKNHKCQIHGSNNELGGEIFVSDFNNKPFLFMIKDIEDNINNSTYFEDFDPSLYNPSLILPMDCLTYDTKPIVQMSAGLPVGTYSYMHRYVSDSGDRTNFSIPTPLIYIAKEYDIPDVQDQYTTENKFRTYGADPNPLEATQFGINLRFRVNNIYDYNYIEIVRISHNEGTGLDFQPRKQIVKRIAITPGQLSVINYTDSNGNIDSFEDVSEQESDNYVMNILKKAKAIRYYYNKLVLGNIEYESRKVGSDQFSFEEVEGSIRSFPILRDIGIDGLKDAYSFAHYKPYMNGEKYGFYIVFWDSTFTRTFAEKIDGIDNYEFPNLRDEASDDTIFYSEKINGGTELPYLPDTDTVSAESKKTHDFLDATNLKVNQGNVDGFWKNICSDGDGPLARKPHTTGTWAGDIGYKPNRPVGLVDRNDSYGMNAFRAITDNEGDDAQVFRPHLFFPKFYSMGLGIKRLTSYPNWATSFSIVRTKPAKRVLAQALAVKVRGDREDPKSNSINIIFPDIENYITDQSVRARLESASESSSLKLQFVAPMGSFPDVRHFRGRKEAVTDNELHIDVLMRSYIQGHNIDSSATATYGYGGDSGYIGIANVPGNSDERRITFSRFNNGDGAGSIVFDQSGSSGNELFDIVKVERTDGDSEGIFSYTIDVKSSSFPTKDLFYQFDGQAGDPYYESCPPLFLCNLIDTSAVISEGDFEQLLPTGCNIKLKSIIGISNGLPNQSFALCGERWQDVIGKNSSYDHFIYVKRKNSNTFDPWIWIGNKSSGEIETIESDIDNETTVWNGERIYGTYTFDEFYNTVKISTNYIPEEGSLIYVFYDNRSDTSHPIEVYGGDVNLGANYYIHKHRQCDEGGGEGYGTETDNVMLHTPIHTVELYEEYVITRDIRGIEAEVENVNYCYIGGSAVNKGRFRQVIHQYFAQTRWASFLDYTISYPRVNYVMRPGRWKSKGSDSWSNRSGGLIYDQYNVDYPDEYKRWIYGGFKFGKLNGAQNVDYIKSSIHDKYNYVSSLLFEENTKFPNRVIWSETRPIQTYNAPGLRTFRPSSIFDISDHAGGIKYLFSMTGSQGDNLFAACEDDFCLLVARKRTISDSQGNTIGLTAVGDVNFITEQIWRNLVPQKAVPEEWWKSISERGSAMFYANENGVFLFDGSSAINIIDELDFSSVYRDIILRRDITDMFAYYDTKHEEYNVCFKFAIERFNVGGEEDDPLFKSIIDGIVIQIVAVGSGGDVRLNNAIGNRFFVQIIGSSLWPINFVEVNDSGVTVGSIKTFDDENGWYEIYKTEYTTPNAGWIITKLSDDDLRIVDNIVLSYSDTISKLGFFNGFYTYNFDRIVSSNSKTYGLRNEYGKLKVSRLDKGFKISGENIKSSAMIVINPEMERPAVFPALKVNSNSEPTSVGIYEDENFYGDPAVSIPSMKDYGGWFSYIPKIQRQTKKVRVSGKKILIKISNNNPLKFVINSVSLFFNKFK